ncbi:MAG: SirB2 family protein [Cocleimonas sp.]
MEANILQLHIVIGALALLVFIVRGVMMLASSKAVNSRGILAIAAVFTILLFASGVYMGFGAKLSFADGFMLTKIIGLLLFVAFGVIALKQGLSKPVASILWLLGLAAFVYTYLIGAKFLAPLF